jgi:malonyl-CoA/methylmalonyl-CoA synthetase
MPDNPIFRAIASHDPKSTAIIHSESGRKFTYGGLLHDVAAAKDLLSETASGTLLPGKRVAFLAENGYDYVGGHSPFYMA